MRRELDSIMRIGEGMDCLPGLQTLPRAERRSMSESVIREWLLWDEMMCGLNYDSMHE